MNKELIKIDNIPQKYKWYYSKYLPFHTLNSTVTFFGCLGYLLWTINYLLLFSADIQPSIQESILQSFGISQLFSIFLIHPMTLLFTLLFSWIYNKYIVKSKNVYKPLYFYSDPFTTNKSLGLTTHLSKSLFVTSIALSSINQPTDDRIIAPAKGLIAQLTDLNLNQNSIDYYDKMLSVTSFEKGYISSDSINHSLCLELIKKYNLKTIEADEVKTIMFASTCKTLILSGGTFSWLIAFLGFYTEKVYYPRNKKTWYGDIFVYPEWIPVNVD
jgi:hypothetical protein